MKTDFETLKAIASYTINHLLETNIIEIPMDKRLELIEAMATEYGVSFATDEDIKQQAIEEVEDKMGRDLLPEDVTESEVYNHARKEIIKAFSGECISGLYLVESLHLIATRIKNFIINSELVDDVFGTDEEITSFLIAKIRYFSLRRGQS